MRFLTSTILLVTLTSSSLAAPQLLGSLGNAIGQLLQQIPLLSTPPPAFLMTTQPSPQCADVNKGALLCCQSSFNGDIPIFVQAAPLIAYKLNPNSINCLYGTRNFTDCGRGVELCCQVDQLATTPISDIVSLALYCNTPSQNESSVWTPSS
ncbi:uncharacterized protein LY89DRAFT_679089 [Mollisia scopiformis]|uniref:Hydrophobin n=1 Tax=Mollisia scopiformis TaxID=149040 RepID=A0A194XTW5_MOLSC|nr:uncharacterized protein LY89DRAFT_679089 [Mollisia scopiformis]KUJ23765.1 hypothetical protein LY89DRAFT_679089 [Mollisia scopiformis]